MGEAEESVKTQYEHCMKEAAELADGLPIEVYVDVDRSAANPYAGVSSDVAAKLNLKTRVGRYERLEYQAMFDAMLGRRCAGFVVRRFDRMNRSRAEIDDLVALMSKRPSLKLGEAERGEYDLRTASGILMAHFLADMAEHEVRINRDRRKDKLGKAYALGLAVGPLAPGYAQLKPPVERTELGPDGKPRTRKTNREVIPADAQVIRDGWDYLFGRVGDDLDAYLRAVQEDPVRTESLAKVARLWNAHGFKRQASTGRNGQVYRTRPWTGATVLNTLCSATLAAKIEVRVPGDDEDEDDGRIVVEDGAWDPILSWDQVQRARRLRDRRAELFGETLKAGGRSHAALLTGRLECGICGSRQVTHRPHHQGSGPETLRYQCNGAAKDQPDLPEGVKRWHLSRKCAKVDDYVVTYFLRYVQNHKDLILRSDGGARFAVIARLEAARDAATAELATLDRLHEAHELSTERWARDTTRQERIRDEASRKLDDLGPNPYEALAPLAAASSVEAAQVLWERIGDLEDQRALLGLVVSRVVLLPTGRFTAPAGPEPSCVPPGMQWCRKCGGVWPLDDFYPQPAPWDPGRRMKRCVRCVSEAAAQRYQEAKQGTRRHGYAADDRTIRIVTKDLLGAGSADQTAPVHPGSAEPGGA